MGYPDGVKGYHLCNSATGAFFIACDVIFDENLQTSDNNNNEEEEPVVPLSPPLSLHQALRQQQAQCLEHLLLLW